MKVIKPFDITDSNMTSTIAEPDLLLDEIEWVDPLITSEFGSLTESYYAAALGIDGNIYCVGSGPSVLEIDPVNKTVSTFGFYAADYLAMVLANDGKMYCVGKSGSVLEIDTANKTTSLFGSIGTYYRTATLGADGNIYCIGYTSGQVLEIDPVAKSTSTFGSAQSYYRDGTLANNGRIYFVGLEGFILELNTESKSINEIGGGLLGSYRASTLGDDGNIYGVGSAGTVLLIDPLTASYSTFAVVNGIYSTATLSSDGYIYCTGYTDNVLQIDTGIKSTSYFGLSPSSISASTADLNGNIYSVGDNGVVLDVRRKYLVGEKVMKISTHRSYVAAGVTSDDPEAGVNLAIPSWVDSGPTNKYGCFDESPSSYSTGESPVVIETTPGQLFDSIVGLNINGATSINVTVTDPVEGVVYNHDIDMVDNSQIVSWSTYLWNDFVVNTSFALVDLPFYKNGTIKITFVGSGDIQIGALLTGNSVTLGEANYGSSVQQLSFNRIEEDEFGNVTIIKRPSAKLVNYDVSVMRDNLSYVYGQLEELDGINAVWLGTNDANDLTIVYGYHRDNNIGIDTPTLCKVTIQVRGLI